MNVLRLPIESLIIPAPAPPESVTGASTRRRLAFWGAMLVVLHAFVGLTFQLPPALKPLIPEPWWELMAAKSIELIFLAFLIPAVLVRDGLTLSDIGFAPSHWKSDLRQGLLGGAGIWLLHDSLLKLAAVGAGGRQINTGMLSAVATLSDTPVELCGLIFSTVVLGPLIEEVIYRGCLMSSTRAGLGGRPTGAASAVVLSGLIFTSFHALGHPLYYAVYFVTGLAFALFYQRTGSLASAVAAHAVVNGLFAARVGLQVFRGPQ